MKLILPLILAALLAGCGTPSTQKPMFERTLKRDVYYCISNSREVESFKKIRVIEKIVNIPQEDSLFKRHKRNLEYIPFGGGSQCGTFPYPSTAYFKWIDLSTGKIYEETANLHEALEGMSVHGNTLHFAISGNNKLFIYMKPRDIEKKPDYWPKVPELERISVSNKYEKFWQLHPQPSPTKGLK